MLTPKKKSALTARFLFRDGMEFELRHVCQARFDELGRKATVNTWIDHNLVKEKDDDKFYKLVAPEMIVGWSGVTGALLRDMVDLETYPAPEELLPYSSDDAFVLLRYCIELDVWATRHCKALEEFQAAEDAKRKNALSPSPAINSSHADEAATAS